MWLRLSLKLLCFAIRTSWMSESSALLCKMIVIASPSVGDLLTCRHRNQDEGPRAYIETTLNSVLSATEVHHFMIDKVPPYKYLSGGISFIPSIPRNSVNSTLPSSLHVISELTLYRMERSYVHSCGNWPKWNSVALKGTTMEYARFLIKSTSYAKTLRIAETFRPLLSFSLSRVKE